MAGVTGTDTADLIDGTYADDSGEAVSGGADTVNGFKRR